MKTKRSSEAQVSVPRTLHVIETVIPGVSMIRTYQRRWLRSDLVAGVTIFAMLVPQGMAYGELAGVAPVAGLYTAIGALVGYALFGSSRRLMIGPEASSAILVATTLAPIAAGSDPATYAMLASVLALLIVISRISRPHDAVLVSVEGIDGYHDIDAYTGSETVPGLIAYRFDAPLFFANADRFLTQARELIAAAGLGVKWFLIDAEAIIDIDVTAAEMLKKLQSELKRKGIVLAIARTSEPLQRMLKRCGLTDLIGSEHFYPTVGTGVQAFIDRQSVIGEGHEGQQLDN